MYVCIYLYVYTYIHTYIHVCVCVCVYAWLVLRRRCLRLSLRVVAFAFVGTNVVKVFTEAIASGHNYLLNPPSDDFYAGSLSLSLSLSLPPSLSPSLPLSLTLFAPPSRFRIDLEICFSSGCQIV